MNSSISQGSAHAQTQPTSASGSGSARSRHGIVWPEGAKPFSTHEVQSFKHTFHEHPLMQLPELAQLAKKLVATKQCRFIQPGSDLTTPFFHGDADPQGRTIDEVFRRIEEPGSWVALYNVETDPVYRGFLDEVIASMRPLVEREQPGIFNVGGFIFISAPPSVTPFHIDRENNFWLQVKGRKVMNVWNPDDRVAVSGRDRDEFIVYATLDNVKLHDGLRERSHEFNVGAGDGVYFPSTSPHMTHSDPGWTTPGDGVSVSIGVVFYTDVTRRHAYVHAVNLQLRRLGLTPTEPGESAWRDQLKYLVGRALIWAKKTFRGYQPRVGF